jgi:hypothetical protein
LAGTVVNSTSVVFPRQSNAVVGIMRGYATLRWNPIMPPNSFVLSYSAPQSGRGCGRCIPHVFALCASTPALPVRLRVIRPSQAGKSQGSARAFFRAHPSRPSSWARASVTVRVEAACQHAWRSCHPPGLLQLCVFGLGFGQDGDVRVGVFP